MHGGPGVYIHVPATTPYVPIVPLRPPIRRRVTAVLAGALLAAPLAAVGAQQPAAARPAADTAGDAWRIITPPQASLVLARDGSLIGVLGREKRVSVPIRTLPAWVGNAFVAVEDQRFYQHDGVDLIGIAGAMKDAVTGDLRGASTITQQLVGNMHPTIIDRSDRGPVRKLREQAAAREMERHYTKAQILEAYLNQIHFGHGWFGIELAARHYFGKGAAQLTIAEAATLAAVPKGPALYDPLRYPQRVIERRNVVLRLMAQQKYITDAQAAEARRLPIGTAPNTGYTADASYFVDVVRVQAERAGVPVRDGGFRVYTSLDPLAQNAAVSALVSSIDELEKAPGYPHPTFAQRKPGSSNYLQGIVITLDPSSGDVRALVGGRDYRDSPFNRAVNGMRQPGSAFKPIVYAAAVAESIAPNAIIPDTALAIPVAGRRVYRPANADGEFLGPLTMREALTRSRNPVAVQLAQRVTLDTVATFARRFGIDAPVVRVPSSAIGASVLQPLDLVAAYGVLANLGAFVAPRFVYRVENLEGKAVWVNPTAAPRPVIDPRVAFIVRDMLRDVVERGTASSVRRYVPASIPVAGKTGTTNDNTDVWFVGMTPDLVTGVWLGFDSPRPIAPGAAGGTLAAPVFGRMMARVYSSGSRPGGGAGWIAPDGIIAAQLDRTTGSLADPTTPDDRRYTEYFLEGTEPLPIRVNGWRLFKAGPIVF